MRKALLGTVQEALYAHAARWDMRGDDEIGQGENSASHWLRESNTVHVHTSGLLSITEPMTFYRLIDH